MLTRRWLLALLLAAFALASFQAPAALAWQDPWDEDPLAEPEVEDNVRTHEVIEYFPDTQVIRARYMADDWSKLHGPYNGFYEDGTPKVRAHYK
jgi:hypothetical protein